MAAASVHQARSVLLGMQGSRVRLKVFRAAEKRTFEVQLHREGALGMQKQSMSEKLKSLRTRIDEQESVIDLLRMQLSCAQAREAKFHELLSIHTHTHKHTNSSTALIPRARDNRVCSSTSRSSVHNPFLPSGAETSPAAASSVNAQPAASHAFGSFSSWMHFFNPINTSPAKAQKMQQKEPLRASSPPVNPPVEASIPPATPPRPAARSALDQNELHCDEAEGVGSVQSKKGGIGATGGERMNTVDHEPVDQAHSRKDADTTAQFLEQLFQETGTQTSPDKSKGANTSIPVNLISARRPVAAIEDTCFDKTRPAAKLKDMWVTYD